MTWNESAFVWFARKVIDHGPIVVVVVVVVVVDAIAARSDMRAHLHAG